MHGILKKADIILGIALIILCGVLCWAVYGSEGGSGTEVEVRVDGELYGTYDIKDYQTVDIENERGNNRITISDGKVLMTEADCPDGYCLNQHKQEGGISGSHQTIVCLPNRVVVSIIGSGMETESESESEFEPDAVSGTPRSGG